MSPRSRGLPASGRRCSTFSSAWRMGTSCFLAAARDDAADICLPVQPGLCRRGVGELHGDEHRAHAVVVCVVVEVLLSQHEPALIALGGDEVFQHALCRGCSAPS